MTIFYAGQAHVFDDVHPNKVCFSFVFFVSVSLLTLNAILFNCNGLYCLSGKNLILLNQGIAMLASYAL